MLGLSPEAARKFMRAATAGQVTAGSRPRSSSVDRFQPLPAPALEPGVHRRRSAARRDPGTGLSRQQAIGTPLPAAAARDAHPSGNPAATAHRPGGDPVDL